MIRMLILAVLSLLFLGSEAFAEGPVANAQQTYFQAQQASAVAAVVAKEIPSQELKDLLLTSSRPDDREFVKSMLVEWKKNSKKDVRPELNAIVVRDATGNVVMRIVPVAGNPGAFEINGKIWKAPPKGAVAASAKTVSSACERCETLTYLSNFLATPEGADPTKEAKRRLEIFSPATDLISDDGSTHKNWLSKFTGQPVEVKCTTESATGHANFFGVPHDFSVAKNGDIMMKPMGDKTGKATFKVTLENRIVHYAACADSFCEKTKGESKESPVSFIKWPERASLVDVEVARTFRPRDSKEPLFPIEFACREEADCVTMQIRGIDKLSKRDREWAEKYRDRANAALLAQKLATDKSNKGEEVMARMLVWGLMPLHACCQEKPCVDAVLKDGIKMVPTDTFKDARTTH